MSSGSIPPRRVEPPAKVDDEELDERDGVRYRGAGSDPTFGYLLALALSFGLLPLIPNNADMRYTLVWGLLGIFGVMSWLFGTTTRIERDRLENVIWGGVFGLIVAAPLLLFGGATLTTTVHLMFSTGSGTDVRPLSSGAVLAYLVFVMPMAETLFFRGLMQQNRSVVLVGVLSSILSIALFIPMLDFGKYPLVSAIISIVLVLINLMYSYVRQRSGLAAAWVCQIVVNVVLLFLPYITLK
ncbi:MAG: CPBP family glutamic-type intramembrane protease [Chloroflexota bacterium]